MRVQGCFLRNLYAAFAMFSLKPREEKKSSIKGDLKYHSLFFIHPCDGQLIVLIGNEGV